MQRAKDVGLDPQIIFFGLLPPIILEAGFTVKHRGFFANFWNSFLLGIVGTVLSTMGVALALYWLGRSPLFVTALSPAEAMQYGSLISAIDPIASQLVLRKSHVPSLLPELVFGERSLNNAISTIWLGSLRPELDSSPKPQPWRFSTCVRNECRVATRACRSATACRCSPSSRASALVLLCLRRWSGTRRPTFSG
jgi:hypothetical protein